ncbi:translocon-associated protein subunit alpha [Marchantia polymorpha subsp. ruderalis]|uniref:Translocon-associated protein subunit alpha n=2 Tax=Marchantia polymorpha TaxID=3197 RepID=A0A176VUV7_MARPO|nr:hypothetical protein AXG93_2752s2200 [Marchantia polymorpha subsp. ruderalis]PTQ33230.1 hypothetical protein MARPO_0091s0074 [Marchantia polymorpha]BBN15589.1 hypothetical protein Mp_6g20820 [Marchantia polymorpha subsp. ruderalis]|eukprot:PTQ33230.1 hypothetical protein MARPO_0091s0074 [Marchantia polymorpha]
MASLKRTALLLLLSSLLLLFVTAPFAAGSEAVNEEEVGGAADGGEVGLVDEEVDEFFSGDSLGSAPGVETVFHFPKNTEKMITAGESAEIIVGLRNSGEVPLKVTSVRASINLPFDHRIFVQNFTAQEFANATVPPGVQASFAYSFTISKYLQPGGFALVASIYYDIDDQPHRTVFHNGTVEVIEAHGFFSGETLFLITLGMGLLGLGGMWLYGQAQKFSKKTRRTKKVETGTRSTDAAANEWLQGTSFTAKRPTSIAMSKSKKKK